jgi:hypothetical protein
MNHKCLCGKAQSRLTQYKKEIKQVSDMLDMGYLTVPNMKDYSSSALKEIDKTDKKMVYEYSKLFKIKFIGGVKSVEFGGNELCNDCNISLSHNLFNEKCEPKYTDETFDLIFMEFVSRQFGRTIKEIRCKQ